MRRRSALVVAMVLVVAAVATWRAAPSRSEAPQGDDDLVLIHVDGDMAVFGPLPPRTRASAEGTSGYDGRVTHHQGYATFGDPDLLEHYEVRLIRSDGIEAVRPFVMDAAGEVTAVGGQSLSVRHDAVDAGGERRGHIDVVVSSSSPCRGWWLACGGPDFDDDGTIRSGRIWVNPRLLRRPAHQIANTVRHELGHTLGLAHYEHEHEGRLQTMHPSSFDAAVYESGDTAGLRAVSGSGRVSRVLLDSVHHEDGHLRIAGRIDDPAPDMALRIEIDDEIHRHVIEAAGFEHQLAVGPGEHRVCVSLERAGSVSSRNCSSGFVPGDPVGALESVLPTTFGLVVTGWATDPQASEPVTVVVQINGSPVEVVAGEARPFGTDERHGFTLRRRLPVGPHLICASVPDVGGGSDADLGCRTVTVSRHTLGNLGVQTL